MPRTAPSAKPAGSRSTAIGGAPAAQIGNAGALPRAIGSAAPLVVESAAPDGSWVTLCQPRDASAHVDATVAIGTDGKLAGPRLYPMLSLGGRELGIDAYLDSDPSGRWLLLVRSGRTVLFDSQSGEEIDLEARGADTRIDRAEQRARRAIAFDPAAPRVVWVERNTNKSSLVVFDLVTRAEQRLDAGSGEVWRVNFAPGVDAFVLQMVAADTTGNGRIDWPVPRASSAPDDCARHAPIATQSVWQGRGDAVVTRIVTPNAPLRDAPGFVALFSDGIVEREPTGRLVLVRGRDRKVIADAKCNAWIYAASALDSLLLGACTGTNPALRTRLTLWSATGRRDLELDVNPVGPSEPSLSRATLVPVYPGRDAAIVDLSHQRVIPLKTGDSVLATWQDRVLVLRDHALVVHNVANGVETAVPGHVVPLFDLVQSSNMVVASPLVVDLDTGKLVGSVAGRPLAVARDGRVLVATGGDANAQRLAIGPLVWQVPIPQK